MYETSSNQVQLSLILVSVTFKSQMFLRLTISEANLTSDQAM